ncbi:hypothetical protein [Nonomuraea aridisoli]|uniref:Uncharacterized protein n=1 Tax=Nonomuraea aridisoli TaxID=2070368 RepID=A0A2W2DJA7_9ACTN|nr:hypothetical protein [Nonomuraea aridisoli]PZG05165.1 hypothetical protein C1J01_43785 [Nonomuraea aridisoli]
MRTTVPVRLAAGDPLVEVRSTRCSGVVLTTAVTGLSVLPCRNGFRNLPLQEEAALFFTLQRFFFRGVGEGAVEG